MTKRVKVINNNSDVLLHLKEKELGITKPPITIDKDAKNAKKMPQKINEINDIE